MAIKVSSHTYTPTTGVGPFTYSWFSENTCVTFDKPTGTIKSGESFTTSIYVTDTTCFDYGTDIVELEIQDSNGCVTHHMYTPTDPCSALRLSSIGQGPGELDYSASASGGAAPYSFN